MIKPLHLNNKALLKHLIVLCFIFSAFELFAQIPTYKWVKKGNILLNQIQTVDADDNIIIAGDFHGTIELENITFQSVSNTDDILVFKYSSKGILEWYKQIHGPADPGVTGIASDINGDIIVTGNFYDTLIVDNDTLFAKSLAHNPFVIKFSHQGVLKWVMLPGYNDTGCMHSMNVITDNENNIMVYGNFYYGENAVFSDTIIPLSIKNQSFYAKFNTEGDFLWVRIFQKENQAFAFDKLNNLILLKNDYWDSDSYWIYKYSADGDSLWGKKIDISSVTDFYIGAGLICDDENNLYLTGSYKGNLIVGNDTFVSRGMQDVFLLKLNSLCEPLWCRVFGGPISDGITPSVINISNHIIVAGSFMKEIHFENDSIILDTNIFKSNYLAEFDKSGNLIFVRETNGSCIKLNASKSIYINGQASSPYFDNCFFDGGYYIAMLNNESPVTQDSSATFDVFPNPFDNYLTINTNPDFSNNSLIELYNIQGALIKRFAFNNISSTLYLGYLAKGIYILRLINENTVLSRKIEKY